MSRYASHTFARLFLYGLLWLVAVSLLGVAAYRVHVTESLPGRFGFYDPIVVEIIVATILTILWAPFAMLMLAKDRFNDTFGSPRVHHEIIGVTVLWIFWLVGAVTFTNLLVPGKNYCPIGKTCDVLVAILALSWTGWSLLTLLLILALLNNAALSGSVASTREKRSNVTA